MKTAGAHGLEPFYRSAIIALSALEAAGARRPSLGPDPDVRWKAFRGELRALIFATVPDHGARDVPPGTLRSIERQLEPHFGKGWLRG